MYKCNKRNQHLIPLDPKTEATTRKQRDARRRKKKKEAVMAGRDNRVLREYALLQMTSVTSSIASLAIKVHNFELWPTLISLLEKDQFSERPFENPNMHLRNFLVKCDIIKLNGVLTNAIRIRLFPVSLKDKVRNWLQNEETNAFATWDALSKAFPSKHFPLGKTCQVKGRHYFIHPTT